MNLRIVIYIFEAIVFLFAISVHESAHAWTASRLGDQTARMLGRITLNPIAHIDPLGTLVVPLIGLISGGMLIGWAKPTPVNTRFFKNLMRDDILTTAAGPASNFLIAIAAVILLKGLIVFSGSASVKEIVLNAVVAGQVESDSVLVPLAILLGLAMQLNILLGVFNLIPVPPLDGGHILRHFLPTDIRAFYDRFGMFFLLFLFVFGGRFIAEVTTPILNSFYRFLL